MYFTREIANLDEPIYGNGKTTDTKPRLVTTWSLTQNSVETAFMQM